MFEKITKFRSTFEINVNNILAFCNGVYQCCDSVTNIDWRRVSVLGLIKLSNQSLSLKESFDNM